MRPFEFLDRLFSGKPESHKVLLWTLPDKFSHWLDTIEQSKVERWHGLNASKDIYFGLGTTTANFGLKKRAESSDVRGLPGFWLDVDVQDQVHKKKNIPSSIDHAFEILRPITDQLEPSLSVNSGHGLHIYWLFEEFQAFKDQDDNLKFATLSEKFTRLAQSILSTHNITLDSLYDLARVLRIPGTNNYKVVDDPKAVEVIRDSGRVHSVESFEEIVEGVQVSPSLKGKSSKNYDGLIFDETREPLASKLFALVENFPQFKETFTKSRTDLTDSSDSGYEFSLAIQCVKMKWTDQEILDLFMYWRKQNNLGSGLPTKKARFHRTIVKAREKIEFEKSQRINKTSTPEGKNLEEIPSEIVDKDVIREQLKDTLGIGIHSVEKYGRDDPEFVIVLEEGRKVTMGNVAEYLSQTHFRNCMYAATEVLLQEVKRPFWKKVFGLLDKLLVVVDTDSDWKTKCAERFDEYFGGLTSMNLVNMNKEVALKRKCPHQDENKLYIHVPSMLKTVQAYQDRRLTNNKLRAELHRMGFKPIKLQVKDSETEKYIQVRYYEIDRKVFDEFMFEF